MELQADQIVTRISAGKHTHWRVNFGKFDQIDGDTEFMLGTQIHEDHTVELTMFNYATMDSIQHNYVRSTVRPGDIEELRCYDMRGDAHTITQQELDDNGLSIIHI